MHILLDLILRWFMEIANEDSAEIKKFELFCRPMASKILTDEGTWVKIGEAKFVPFPVQSTFQKVIILNVGC